MYINKISSLEEYQSYILKNNDKIQKLREIDFKLNEEVRMNQGFYIHGFSWTAQSKSEFWVDSLYSNGNEINLRERLICNKTQLNNRIRGCIHVFETLFRPQLNDKIYLTEQVSLLAKWMTNKYCNLVGSEYFGSFTWLNKIKLSLKFFPTKIQHQDLTMLSFNNNLFNYVLSFDCFEHIPNYKKALKEIFRVLKPNGKLLFSVPFDLNNPKNHIRATINNGEIKHLTEPEYHGDPLSINGCLSFYTFGWELLNDLRNAGFKKVYIVLYWSEKYCYLGGEQILICAEK